MPDYWTIAAYSFDIGVLLLILAFVALCSPLHDSRAAILAVSAVPFLLISLPKTMFVVGVAASFWIGVRLYFRFLD